MTSPTDDASALLPPTSGTDEGVRADARRCVVSLVVPVFNEELAVEEFHRSVREISSTDVTFEVIFVDDGSVDATPRLCAALAASEPSVTVVVLSRRFGKEAALCAGIDAASGDAVVPMDVDLQHPIEALMLFTVSDGAEAGRQIAYTVADITAKGLYGLMILSIAKARSVDSN